MVQAYLLQQLIVLAAGEGFQAYAANNFSKMHEILRSLALGGKSAYFLPNPFDSSGLRLAFIKKEKMHNVFVGRFGGTWSVMGPCALVHFDTTLIPSMSYAVAQTIESLFLSSLL